VNIHLSRVNRPRETSGFKLVAVFILLTLCTFTIVPAVWSQQGAVPSSTENSEGGTASSVGMQAAAAVSTILYFPLKAAFAIGGGIVGGLTYIFSGANEKAAMPVWETSVYGTYFITPDHLQGNRPIRFLGVADSSDAPASASAPEPIR
jgi:hypothetical protein